MFKEFKIQDYFFFTLLAVALVLSFIIFLPFLTPILLAVVVATVFYPLHKKISKWVAKGNVSSYLSSFISMVIILAIVIIPLSLISIKISMEAKSVYEYYSLGGGDIPVIEQINQSVHSLIQKVIPGAQTSISDSVNVKTYITGLAKSIFANIDSIFSSVAKIFFELIIFVLALFYLLKDGLSLRKHLVKISPLADGQDEAIIHKMNNAVMSVIRGTLLVALIQGILTGIGFMFTGVPNPALWGATAMIASLIPGFGTSLVLVPAIVFLLIKGNVLAGIILIIWSSLAVGLIDNFLGPKLMSGGTGIHPIILLLSVVGGVSFFGPVGFLAGPLLISFVMSLISVYKTSDSNAVNS